VFGIANIPHRLIALDSRKLSAFENTDPAKVSAFFNEHFAPEIDWSLHVDKVDEKHFGMYYSYPSQDRPVVCTRDAGKKIKESDIYYRYRGRTSRIKHQELLVILDERRQEEQRLSLKHLRKIAKVGVRDTGVFDLQTAQVTGAKGAFIIDESHLSQLQFIKEGDFNEVTGKPTLKLIGSIKSASGSVINSKQVLKTKGIRTADIILAFLDRQKVSYPQEYITQVCFESTCFLPVYYFMSLAGVDALSTTKLLKEVISRS
jgi:hypothetical protein